MSIKSLFILLIGGCIACSAQKQKNVQPVQSRPLSATALRMARQGLVNIKDVDPSIKVAPMYARTDNFVGRVLYSDLREAYLLPRCAEALKKAQAELKRRRPDLSLCIFDATRPMSVQQQMWNVVKGTKKRLT